MAISQIQRMHPELIEDGPETFAAWCRVFSGDPLKLNTVLANCIVRATVKWFDDLEKNNIVFGSFQEMLETKNTKLPNYLQRFVEKNFYAKYNIPAILPVLVPIDWETVVTRVAYYRDPARKNYYVADNFWSEFKDISIESLRAQDLIRGTGYIFIPAGIKDDEGTVYHHMYFCCGPVSRFYRLKKHRCKKGAEHSDEIVSCALISGEGIVRIMAAQLPKDPETKLVNFFEGAEDIQVNPFADHAVEVRVINYNSLCAQQLNLLAYLASGQPDISAFKNDIVYRSPTSSAPANKSRHLSLLDINLIGFSWMKERITNLREDAWLVRAHLRWQRYGQRLSRVKLITIKEHDKHWKEHDDLT